MVLVGRDTDKLAASRQRVHDFAGGDIERIHTEQADLLDVAATRSLGERLVEQFPEIDVLVNNAGALFHEHALSDDGFERSLAINLVAPFVLTETLISALTAAEARVVNMSSGGMYLQPLVLNDLKKQEMEEAMLSAADSLRKECDVDESGHIDFKEFLHWYGARGFREDMLLSAAQRNRIASPRTANTVVFLVSPEGDALENFRAAARERNSRRLSSQPSQVMSGR